MLIELLKAIVIGIVEGITEWLPISSSTHIELACALMRTEYSEAFFSVFEVVIQLGAILAVIILYWKRLWPWAKKTELRKRRTFGLWLKIIVAAIPAALVGLILDDWRDEHLGSMWIKVAALVVYGVLFVVIERLRKGKDLSGAVREAEDIPLGTALKIGLFQLLSLIPGTSRSGSTILGGTLVGVSRKAATEFSFFVAIPIMFGASGLKAVKYAAEGRLAFAPSETVSLIAATVTAFVVSMLVVRTLVGFIRSHSFEGFGWYRIVLGAVIAAWLLFGQ